MATMKPRTLICTVGTSLPGNLAALPSDQAGFRESRFFKDLAAVAWSDIERVKKYFCDQRWPALGRALAALPENASLCGAEINSNAALYEKKWLEATSLFLLVSDTDQGRQTGEILKAYYETRKRELGLQQIDYRVIERLQDQRPGDFKIYGLRNLVRMVGRIIQETDHNPSLVAINATGGYKAQIATTALIGIALDIAVYYKHERFNEIIAFPPLPVALDYDVLGRYGDLLLAFERGEMLADEEAGMVDEKLRALLDEVEIDGRLYRALSPIGQIYLTGFRMRHPRPVNMPAAGHERRRQPAFRDDHYPSGFKEFVNKVWRETSWITSCHSLPYSGQAAIRHHRTGFYLEPAHMENGHEEPDRIIGTYVDRNGFGARYEVLTTSIDRTDLIWAVDYLNRNYC